MFLRVVDKYVPCYRYTVKFQKLKALKGRFKDPYKAMSLCNNTVCPKSRAPS